MHLAVANNLLAILISNPLGLDPVASQLGPQLGPHGPVGRTEEQHADADNGKDVVRVSVLVPAGLGRDEGHEGEERIGQEVRVPGAGPVLLLAELEVDEAGRDKGVDPGARVRVEVDDEVVGRAGGRRQQHNHRDDPVQEESGRRRAKGLGRGPEAAERQQTLLAKLLVQAGVRKADGQDVAEVGQGDKGRQSGAAGTDSKHVAEEDARHDHLGLGQFRLWDGGKVGHVGEHVEDGGTADGQGHGDGERLARVLELADHVVGVLPALEAVDDVQQRIRVRVRPAAAVAVSRLDGKGVVKVARVVDQPVAGQRGEARKDYEQQDDDLEHAQDVEQADAPLGQHDVQQDGKGDAGDGDAAGLPVVRRDLAETAGGEQDVAAKGERVS
ncbi:hypothetical protein PoMZ_12528 [Pyricularia oryzae]|uniref:Uncharacterized protein n=1 Tax=Pyricularia oryzae TaxID=318829 RepID=A0A4P7NUG3_PYROR|nr:hypothetical protein PoMZ_12528 [Pyricularia oryzae]